MTESAKLPPKPWTSAADQLKLLEERGMDVSWEQSEHWLHAVGYYRLSGYSHPFRIRVANESGARPIVADEFKPNTSLHQVATLYEFDRKLKAHLLSALERVEIAVRCRIADVLGKKSVSALDESVYFENVGRYLELKSIIESRVSRAAKSRDAVVLHHQNGNRSMPIWATMEFLDFGDLSRLYSNLVKADKILVAEWFGWKSSRPNDNTDLHTLLKDWLWHLSVVRNTVAHHARLWNREFRAVSPRGLHLIDGMGALRGQQSRIYGTVVVLGQLVKVASPGTTWHSQLANLLREHFEPMNVVTWDQMGFPSDWESRPPFV